MRNTNKPFDVYSGTNLRSQILQTHPFETNTAMQWGINHEAEAIEKYQFLTGNKVEDTGIWLFPDGILAASPDGLVVDSKNKGKYLGIIEVKCPYKLHWDPITNENDWHFYLNYLDDENKLNRAHDYFHQIQGQLVATDLPWCDFIIWSPSKTHIQRIERDEKWKPNIKLLLDFYNSYIICRSEDVCAIGWRAPGLDAPKVDLPSLFRIGYGDLARIEKKFNTSVGYHLARWIYKFHSQDPTHETWSEITKRYLEKAMECVCKACITKLFIERTGIRFTSVGTEEIYQSILNSNWDIPSSVLDNAGKNLPNFITNPADFGEPCLCLKY